MIDPASRELVIIDEEGKVQRTNEEQQKAFEIKRNFESFFQENQNNLNSEEERIIHLIGEQLKANPDINEFAFDRFIKPPFDHLGGINYIKNIFGEDKLNKLISSINTKVIEKTNTLGTDR